MGRFQYSNPEREAQMQKYRAAHDRFQNDPQRKRDQQMAQYIELASQLAPLVGTVGGAAIGGLASGGAGILPGMAIGGAAGTGVAGVGNLAASQMRRPWEEKDAEWSARDQRLRELIAMSRR